MMHAIEISKDGDTLRFLARVDTQYIEVNRFPETPDEVAEASALFDGTHADGRQTIPIQIDERFIRQTCNPHSGSPFSGYTMRKFTINLEGGAA